jgi:hypothetical protein
LKDKNINRRSNLKYLGSVFKKKGICNKIRNERATTRMVNSVLWSRNIGIITKKSIYSSVIGSVTTDGVVIDTQDIISTGVEL